jgi:glycosyltransferase involved in cell wall biosynthesis
MKKSKLPLSIIIPCADDVRLKSCIESIDEDVEIIVVLNGASKEVVKVIDKFDVRKVIISERNLPKALNAGIKEAKYRKMMFMDADCIFQKGAIRKLYYGLDKNFLAKGTVVFERKDFISSIIASVREYMTSDPPKPYNPFLCMRKDIKVYIDNYYFDNDIHWTEDADLNIRVIKAAIKVKYVTSARVFHPCLTLKYDLRSSFRYGIGKRIRVEKGTGEGLGISFSSCLDILKKKGFWSAIYLSIWNCSYIAGYACQIIKDPYNVRRLIKR